MAYKLFLMAVVLALAGGTRTIAAAAPLTEPATVKTNVIVYSSPERPREKKVQEVVPARLVGEYFAGDGLGCNSYLVLSKGGKYALTFSGCLGVYGTAAGDWSIDDKGVKLDIGKSEGLRKERPLGRLYIVSLRSQYLFVEEEPRWWPSAFYCFHKEEARKLIEEENKRINEFIYKRAVKERGPEIEKALEAIQRQRQAKPFPKPRIEGQ